MINNNKVYLIAEIGSAHLGNINLAFRAIKEAKNGGADCVKFQLYNEKTIVHPKLKTLSYIKFNKYKFQIDRFKKMKISLGTVKKLYAFSKKLKIDFCVTPFDPSFVKQISKYVKFFKVASGDLNYIPLLKAISKTKKKVIMSTGMSNYQDIKNSLKYLNKRNVIIMHCVSSYPTELKDINLSNITKLKDFFKLPVGFSDHTRGIEATIASVFFGARIIEKHFVPLKGSSKSADFPLSINYKEMKVLRYRISKALLMIGKEKNGILKCEKYGEKNLKRSIYSLKKIYKSQKFSKRNLICLRPYKKDGFKIEKFDNLLGKKAKKNFKEYELIGKNY